MTRRYVHLIAIVFVVATTSGGCEALSSSSPTVPTPSSLPSIPPANLVATDMPITWVYESQAYRVYDLLGRNSGEGCASNVTWTVDHYGESSGVSSVLISSESDRQFNPERIIPPNVIFEYSGRQSYETTSRLTSYVTTFQWENVACP